MRASQQWLFQIVLILILVDVSEATATATAAATEATASTSLKSSSSLKDAVTPNENNEYNNIIDPILLPTTTSAKQEQAVPMPTRAQQLYHDHEIMVLITFNMGTYFPLGNQDPACHVNNWGGLRGSGNPASFDPYMLDTDQWGQVFQRLGAKHAVLTAKHGCGFLLWPTKVPLRNAVTRQTQPYEYAVGKTTSAIQVDVLDQFVTSMRHYGLGVGFYYSMKNNFYLNMKDHQFENTTHLLPGQVNVTHDDYEAMALDHLQELWTNYGELTEIWFDGGYTTSTMNRLQTMLDTLQPNAVVWRGKGITKSAVAWVGTESGFPHPPNHGEIWSTGCDAIHEDGPAGHPESSEWCPKGCDTTLQENDEWFYIPEVPIRSLSTMIDIYHQTVGRNGVLELDVAVDETGRIPYDHAQRYQELGDYIQSCYGTPLKQWTQNISGYVIELDLDAPLWTDRILLREDQWRGGQRVRDYKVYVKMASTTTDVDTNTTNDWTWNLFSKGQSIGNKRIDFYDSPKQKTKPSQLSQLPVPVLIRGVRFHAVAARDIPLLREISVFAPCPDPSNFTTTIATSTTTS